MSHNPMPGADAPGALSAAGDQAGRVGELAPSELKSIEAPQGQPAQAQEQQPQSTQEAETSIRQLLRTRKREELRKLKKDIAESCKPFLKMTNPHTLFAYRLYNSLIFGERVTKRLAVVAEVLKMPPEDIISYANKNLEGFKVNSARRIVETCENMKAMKLINFHYNFEKIKNILVDIWWHMPWERRDEREAVDKFEERIKAMTVGELLTSWNEVSQKLLEIEKTYNRRGDLVPAMKSAFKEQKHLYNALIDELKKILVERLGAEESRVNTLIEDLPMLLYLEYTGREY